METSGKRIWLTCVIAGLIAGLLFALMYGFGIINPLNTAWVINPDKDIYQAYLGWRAFRISDWRFPWGLYDYFSYPEALPVNQDGTTPHPLYRSVYDAEGNPRGIIHYYSVFHPLQGNLLPQKTYGCIFPGNRTLYLVRVVNAGRFPEDPEEWTELELVMTGAGIKILKIN